jgi:hypothetical protein
MIRSFALLLLLALLAGGAAVLIDADGPEIDPAVGCLQDVATPPDCGRRPERAEIPSGEGDALAPTSARSPPR